MVLGVTWGWSLELQSKGFGEEPAHPRTIEPGNSTGISDEGDGAAHAKFLMQLPYLSREARQGIEDMRQAHEELIALHGIPVDGKGMLAMVALMLFAQSISLTQVKCCRRLPQFRRKAFGLRAWSRSMSRNSRNRV